VEELLDLVRLPGYEKRRPEHLSGGEKQRIALARAIAPSPDLLLLDEPLSALDAGLRLFLRREIRRIQRRIGLTTIYVTHDQEEALSLADRIIVMRKGRIAQQGSPQELYHDPRGSFVARFMGKVNLLPVASADSQVSPAGKERGFYFFRPEDTVLSCEDPGSRDLFALPMKITTVEYVGSHYIVEGGEKGNTLRAYVTEGDFPKLGILEGSSTCWFSVEKGRMKVLPE
jgi:ABC-type Fe3+/spermidine/putrescine transport system ATPase subunit